MKAQSHGESDRFSSILFPAGSLPGPLPGVPACFRDLNLDQVVTRVTTGREEYDLRPFFYHPLARAGDIGYRHDIVHDLQRRQVRACTDEFAAGMRRVRADRASAASLRYPRQRQMLFPGAVLRYTGAVTALAAGLRQAGPQSAGLRSLRDYLDGHEASSRFTVRREHAQRLDTAIRAIRYCLHVKGSRIRVTRYDGEADYGEEIARAFARFRQGGADDYRKSFPVPLELDHVEAGILDLVARLYPEVFGDLDEFCARHADFADDTLTRLDREIQFYLAYLDYTAPMRRAGLSFCFPRVSRPPSEVALSGAFDLALADKLVGDRVPVVCNDARLRAGQRLLVITGPNQGGKTTFARAIGQLHYLAALGLPVPGRQAQLALVTSVLTHFEREEDPASHSGKLQDDLRRIRDVLTCAGTGSVIILNEIFTSTTPADALFLSRQILRQAESLGALCVCVTFLDELASFSPATVSMVAAVDTADPGLRTFRIAARPADGIAYAAAIAGKYGLSYDQVRARVRP
jgi:DNA mismatch repair ATPase MutS